MANERPDRTRIFSHITRTRFLHLEDSLDIGKIRFFIGQYRRRDRGGDGAEAVAFHFLDADDARPLCADLSWAKAADFVDFKGTANGGQPQSRVLKIRGPKDGKYWLQVDNGPGQIIGEGAVKPAGDPEASISIALSLWEARAMALAVIEYMSAYRVAAMISAANPLNPLPKSVDSARHVDPSTGEIRSAQADAEDLFGPEPARAGPDPEPERSQKAEAKETPDEVDPPTFFALANKAIAAGFPLDRLREIIQSQVPWREKHITLSQAMAA